MNETMIKECVWKCGDNAEGHKHYSVLARELNGKLLGRLGNGGMAVNRRLHAVILSKATADRVADEINVKGEFTAKVIPF